MKANEKLDILACQIDIPSMSSVAARDSHLDNVATKIRTELAGHRYDLVVLPELSSMEYSVDAFNKLEQLGETLDGQSYQVFSELAREFEVCIVYGIARKDNDNFFISQVAIDSKGNLIGHFDKLHIANFGYSYEKKYFNPGDHLLIFEIQGYKNRAHHLL